MTLEEIRKDKALAIELKKSAIKHTDVYTTNELEVSVNKALRTENKDEPDTGVIKRTIVGNTYNYLDSHMDVHVGNTFKKSIDERMNKVVHLHDHIHNVTAKVGTFTSIYEKVVNWEDLGINIKGSTIVLMADSDVKKDFNPSVFTQYLSGEIDQHSVAMIYVKIELAINNKDDKEEYATWLKYIDRIANKEVAEEAGFFWAVPEAKLVEISAVLMGSNPITPTVQNIEPLKDTQKEEPLKDTPVKEEVVKSIINTNFY
jgi:hypothetical protein